MKLEPPAGKSNCPLCKTLYPVEPVTKKKFGWIDVVCSECGTRIFYGVQSKDGSVSTVSTNPRRWDCPTPVVDEAISWRQLAIWATDNFGGASVSEIHGRFIGGNKKFHNYVTQVLRDAKRDR